MKDDSSSIYIFVAVFVIGIVIAVWIGERMRSCPDSIPLSVETVACVIGGPGE